MKAKFGTCSAKVWRCFAFSPGRSEAYDAAQRITRTPSPSVLVLHGVLGIRTGRRVKGAIPAVRTAMGWLRLSIVVANGSVDCDVQDLRLLPCRIGCVG